MSSGTAHGGTGTTETAGHDWPWWGKLLGFLLIFCLAIGIGIFLENYRGLYNFNRMWIFWFLLAAFFLWIGYGCIIKTKSETGDFGDEYMCGALFLWMLSAVIFINMLPKVWTEPVTKLMDPYYPTLVNKPNLREFIPLDPDKISVRWVKMDFPSGTDLESTPDGPYAFIQIKMTPAQAKEGFPVVGEVLDKAGNVVGWYKQTNQIESRTDDL